MLATLADLLAPVSVSEFLDVFRARKRLHIAASDPTRAETLLSWRDIDTILSEHALDECLTLMRDGVRVPRHFYTSSEGKRLNVRAFHDLLPEGVSIVVDRVHRWIPKIRQLAVAVEREMQIHTGVNAYMSFAKGGAFKPHWDVHDVLVVQVHGKKRWRVWKAEVPHPIEMADQSNLDASVAVDQEVDMAPGDVLFIPRGEPHAAAVSTNHSVHLTIGLLSQTGIDFLDHLHKEAAKDPLLRMDLPRHSSNDQASAHEAAIKRQLHLLVDVASMSLFLREGDLSRLPASQTALAGALPQMDDVLRLTLRRRITVPDVAPGDGPQPLTIGGKSRHISPASIDALRWLFDHDPATFRELQGELTTRYGQDSIEAAIRELQRFGYIAVMNSR
jgi:hypothetical protein